MTRIYLMGSIALALTVLATPATGRAEWWDDDGITRDELRRFDRFLDDHPAVERDLQYDPWLASDRRYLDDHPSLRDFLRDHPGVREELSEDPRAFMRRERRLDESEEGRERNEITPEHVRTLDRFLADHPEVAHDLRSNPWIVRDRRYLAEHPSFRDFLEDHPVIRDALRERPRALLSPGRAHGEQHRDRHGKPAKHR